MTNKPWSDDICIESIVLLIKIANINIISNESSENKLGIHIFNKVNIFLIDFVLKVA